MRALAILLFATALSACGFQLRGSYALPFSTLHIGLPESNELHAQIRRNVEATSATRIVGSAKDADASLLIVQDQPLKKVLSYDATGRVRENQLERTFSYRLVDAKGNPIAPQGSIIVRRDISFSDALVLSKDAEEAMLWRDMQNDLVQQLMRRLAATKPMSTSSGATGTPREN